MIQGLKKSLAKPPASTNGSDIGRQLPHPFDQLSADEINQACQIVRDEKKDKHFIFKIVTIREPNKKLMMSYLGWSTTCEPITTHIEREALIVLLERKSMECFECIVSLDRRAITKFEHVPHMQPTITPDEQILLEKIILEDEKVIRECLKAGFKDMSHVVVDTWSIGKNTKRPGKRVLQGILYGKTSMLDNPYAHPLNFTPVVDLGERKVIDIDYIKPKSSKYERATIPFESRNFVPEVFGQTNLRKDVKPIIIQQPHGVSFTVKNGSQIDWQKWSMHVSMTYREGLVIRNVSYQDGKEKRPLFYRLGISEMVVPYADPESPFNRKQAFDVGEYGLGYSTNSLNLGCDCLGSIFYLDAVFSDDNGKAYTVSNAICIHEEDYGLLWKHSDRRTSRSDSVRSRRLVISHIATVANYDYGVYYYFYQDGTFECEVKATGIINTSVLAIDETPEKFGETVAPQVNGQHHQHFFTARIDPMIDGLLNSVSKVEVKPYPYPTGHPKNPWGNAFTVDEIILKTTHEGQENPDYNTGKFWKIINQDCLHPSTKRPVGWKITNKSLLPMFAQPDSIVGQRAPYAYKSLWVTPFREDQLYPAGFYVNQSSGEDTLYKWAQEEKNIEQEDIVLWYNFGLTHVVRAEDFPIMPVEYCGFTMKPCNFFVENPAVDVPPSSKLMLEESTQVEGGSEAGYFSRSKL
ncbi:peroxisomal copper amine oxidase [Basidiobolus ranarum]|uniref:Amine oxidase n=1 Tax=Basidiobolus ranarum TaxID=34480 RepID=A0ABR2WKG6_9FUNG